MLELLLLLLPFLLFGVTMLAERGTGNIESATRVVDMDDVIYLLDPDKAPLVLLLSQLKKKTAINPEYKWLEDELGPRWDQINNGGGYASGDTSWIVDNGTYFRVGDVVLIPRTGEVVRIDTIVTNTLTVVERSYGTTAAASLNDNEDLLIIGNVNEEGATLRTIKTTKKVPKTNYCQIFRTPFGFTRTEADSEMYGGKDPAYQKKKMGIEHAVDIERAFWFGEPVENTGGTHPERATGGVLYWISTNVDTQADLTEKEFETWLATVYRYGNHQRKVVFCSSLLMQAINSWARGKLQMIPKDQTYGITLTRYLSALGEIVLHNHWLFEAGPSLAGFKGIAVALDLDFLKYRPFNNADTKLRLNVHAPDYDGEKHEYLTECGLQMAQEKAHGYLNGVTSYT